MSMEYKTFCESVAKKAWAMMKEFLDGEKRIEYKHGKEIVTIVDAMINKLVIDSVIESFPEHGIIGEEWDGWVNEWASYVWITDPIDGTIPYARGIKTSCFSLALLEEGKPIVGCVYQPFLDEMYYAQEWKWSFCNGNPLHVNKTKIDWPLLIWAVWWLSNPFDIRWVLDDLYLMFANIINFQTIAYAWCQVAAWKLEWAIFPGKTPWDIAAVKIIVEEAWWKETDFFWNEQRFDQHTEWNIITNWVVHQDLLTLIEKHVK